MMTLQTDTFSGPNKNHEAHRHAFASTDDGFAPEYYFMAVALLQFVALIGLKKMAGKPMPQ